MSGKIRRYFTDDFKQQIADLHNVGRKRSELIKEYDLTPQPSISGLNKQE